ncbi:hypothetical protein FB472_1218 [Rhodoglobus vestalii]|uniref:Lactococcin 972 family bacteriocin n=1 Tax=Rhodoglobus vestalii TaxID=193384 RepID=A0A8H2K6A3_9MICO|nr:hypothetical protein FB472_1218 [Rhodoglobus vestalii]
MTATRKMTKMGAATAALTIAIVLLGTGPAMAAGGSGTRTCNVPKSVSGYSDQVGSGYHRYYANNTDKTTIQPAYQRGKFNSYTSLRTSGWLIYAPIVYSYGTTCF